MPVPPDVLALHAKLLALGVNAPNIDDDERGRRIAQRRQMLGLATAKGLIAADPLTFSVGRWTFGYQRLQLDPVSGLLELFGVVAFLDNVQLPVDPHHTFLNPPMLVEDPTGPVVVQRDGEDGHPVTTRWRVDPAAALMQVLAHNVETAVARQLVRGMSGT